MKLSHLNGMRALEATLRNGTFTKAAEELGVTVAAVGQHIRVLEEYLSLKLFDRLPSGVRPTREAKAIAGRLTGGFTQIESALSELRGPDGTQRIRVTLSHYVLDEWLSSSMPRLRERAPDLTVNFHCGEELVDLFGGEYDMAIRFSPEPGPDYDFIPLHRGYFMPVCTPEFAGRHDLAPEVRDLTGVPLYRLLDQTSDPAWKGWKEILEEKGIRKDDFSVEQLTGRGTAYSGGGLVLLGLTESFAGLVEGRLVAPLGPSFVYAFSYGYRLVWPEGRELTRPLRVFRDFMEAERELYLAAASRALGVELS